MSFSAALSFVLVLALNLRVALLAFGIPATVVVLAGYGLRRLMEMAQEV